MSENDPIELLFGGMNKLGPGDDAHTLHVVRQLPARSFPLIVDAGCGAGRQTLAIVSELGTPIHAVDSHQPFLDALVRRAEEANLGHLVHAHCMDMAEIPTVFHDIDLLWSEGAAYNIGFANALATWASAVQRGGHVVVSELTWLTGQPPAAARDFFQSAYPAMQSVGDNLAAARRAGYQVLFTHTLPRRAWVDGYYDTLAPRAKALLEHPDSTVQDFAAETVKEIEVFEVSGDSYGYVFYVLQRP